METIKEGRQFLKENIIEGVFCPCCDQYVKLYKHKLSSRLAFCLKLMRKIYLLKGMNRFIKLNEVITDLGIPSNNIEYSKLKYWELIEEEVNSNTKKKNSGFWKLTEKGHYFVLGKITVAAYVRIYNGTRYGFAGEQINIGEASISGKFDYQKLMNN